MDLTHQERRAIMLETQTPAYALTDDVRRATDNIYKRANNLRAALPNGIKVSVRAIVPHQHEYVSGLNVPSNFQTVVGKAQLNAFNRRMSKAKKLLRMRNA
jgi:predicted nucleic acid-binding Zn ribbon protein